MPAYHAFLSCLRGSELLMNCRSLAAGFLSCLRGSEHRQFVCNYPIENDLRPCVQIHPPRGNVRKRMTYSYLRAHTRKGSEPGDGGVLTQPVSVKLARHRRGLFRADT